jgi:hypothetical protein
MDMEELQGLLRQLQEAEHWGEAVLAGGRVRSMQVEEMRGDSVAVVEVLGALQRHEATYALSEFHSLRDLGEQRIQSRRAVYTSSKSMLSALVLETLVPGGGYLYIGETKQALALWVLTGVAVGTAVATGEDGAAGWAPLSAWVKVASLFHLRDKVGAINGSGRQMGMELGAMSGKQSAVPALRLRLSF